MIKEKISSVEFFKDLNKDTMHLVDLFYDKNIQFKDPLVEIRSRQEMKDYYVKMYQNVEEIDFHIVDELVDRESTTLVWIMTLKAKNFNGNKPLKLDGVSIIKFGGPEGKAIYHRDYFDMGAFVYEGLPILGSLVRFVKKKMSNH